MGSTAILHELDSVSKPEIHTTAPPLVSVVTTTYNSELWLGQAIESVISQNTEFPIEIVIADDCSTDGTVSLAKRLQENHPQLIRILERSENVGTQRNYYEAFEQCRGKYIAWLDADDYWTDPDKLTIQVAALEADPTLTICCHYVRWVSRGSNGDVQRECYPTLEPGRHGMESILKSNFLPSPSVVFRNGIQKSLPQWYFDVPPLTDWPLYVVAACAGDILLIDRVMADYTLNPTSAFWGEGDVFWQRMNVEFFNRVESIIPKKFHRSVRAEKGRRHEAIAYALRFKGDFKAARKAAFQAFYSPHISDNCVSKTKGLLGALAREIKDIREPRPAA